MPELKATEWFEELDRGLEYRRLFGVEESWAASEAMFHHVHGSFSDNSAPNVVAAVGDSLVSALGVFRPEIALAPLRPDHIASAPVLERVDNMLLKDLRVRSAVQDAVIYAFLFGTGFVKIGYDSEFGFTPELDVTGQLGLTLSQFDKKGNRIEYGDIKPGMPWVLPVLPHDIIVPWGTRSIRHSPWVAHRVIRHIDDVKADAKYTNVRGLEPTMSMKDFVQSYEKALKVFRNERTMQMLQGRHTGKAEFIELFEIRDAKTGKIKVIATGHDSFLRNEIDPLQLDGLPFVDLSFIPRVRSMWVTPDAYYLRSHQAELIDIFVQTTKQRRAGVLRFLYGEDAMDPDEVDRMMSGHVGAAGKVNGGHSLRDSILPLQAGNNMLAYQDAEAVRQSARETVGFGRNQLGEFASGRRSATEASIVDQRSERRLDRREGLLVDFYEDIIRKVNGVIYKFWTTPRLASIVGDRASQQWIQYRGPDLRGEYDYSVAFSQEAPKTKNQRVQEAFQLYSFLIQDPAVDQYQLRKFLINSVNEPEFTNIFRQEIINAPVQAAVQQQQVQQ